MSESQNKTEQDHPKVRDFKSFDEINQCSYADPESGECDEISEHVLAVEYRDDVKVLPFCEEHANLGDAQ